MRDLYDIHCHILPGVDDGAKDMDMALSMIEKEIDAGVETIILTPHFRKEMFEPDMEDIWSAYDTLVDETRNRISVCIWAVSFMPIWRWWRH